MHLSRSDLGDLLLASNCWEDRRFEQNVLDTVISEFDWKG
jgi:hypothetical protein